jgi:hypothetical protein
MAARNDYLVSTDTERIHNYWIVVYSTLRHVYFFGPGYRYEPGDPKIQQIKEVVMEESRLARSVGLDILFNEDDRFFFAVKKDLPQEDRDFLTSLNPDLSKMTPESNARFGKLLGYPCQLEPDGIGVDIAYLLPKDPTGFTLESLIPFNCTLTSENIEKCKELLRDVKMALDKRYEHTESKEFRQKLILRMNGKIVDVIHPKPIGGNKMSRYTMRTRSNRNYRGGREEIDVEVAKKCFLKADGTPYTKAEIDAAANIAANTTSSFERYLVNSIGTYNGKEAVKTANYCNYGDDMTWLMANPECMQRGARMKMALQKFANMPPQAYAQFGLTSVVNQGWGAVKDTGVNTGKSMFSMFSSKPQPQPQTQTQTPEMEMVSQAPGQTPAPAAPAPKKGWFFGGKRQTRRRSRR